PTGSRTHSTCARSSMPPSPSRTSRATPASSRDLQNERSRASSVAASVSVMTYGISNTEERIDTAVINAQTSRLLDAVQKNFLLHPHAHRTKTNRRRKNTEQPHDFAEPCRR